MITRPQSPNLRVLLFSIHGSIIPVIWRKVLFTVLLSSLVVVTHGMLYHYKVILTATPFTLWGLTLAIFLGFRNSAAYQRFWEARALWGELLVASRNLARQVVTFMPALQGQERKLIINSLSAFPYALRDHLRGNPPSADVELDRLLSDDIHAISSDKARQPNILLRVLGQHVVQEAKRSHVSDILIAKMDEQVSQLSGVLSGCERIKNTPIPYPYILMLHRIVHIYCFLLPFCLVDSIGWFTPLAVCILAYTFFGLDALGDQIADPFGMEQNDLPLDAMSRDIEIAILEIIGEQELPATIKPVNEVLS